MLAVLVVGLLFGLVVMHHASAAGPHGATTSMGVQDSAHTAVLGDVTVPRLGGSSGAVDAGGGHGGVDSSVLLHLCLAILAGVVLILAGSQRWRRVLDRSTRSRIRVIRPAPSPTAPPPSAPARLALLCVLRT